MACMDEWDPLKHGWLEDKTVNLARNWFDRQWVQINLFHEEPEMEDEMSDDDSGAETVTRTVRVMSTVEKKTVTVTMRAVYEIDVYSECDQCGDE